MEYNAQGIYHNPKDDSAWQDVNGQPDILVFKCESCKYTGQYIESDLVGEYNGPDDAPDYYVECKKCGLPLGNYESLQRWIPDYDYKDFEVEIL